MAKKKAARRPTPRKRAAASRAKRKPARQARRRTAARASGRAAKAKASTRRVKKTPAGRRATKTTPGRRAPKATRPSRPAKPPARRRPAAVVTKAAVKKTAAKKAPAKKPVTKVVAKTVTTAPKAAAPARRPPARPSRPQRGPAPGLNRERRTIAADDVISVPSSFGFEPQASAAHSGGRELHEKHVNHPGDSGPGITGGDVDADWESAYSVGDEAPGGDNPTPDQDLVDEIGRAVGVQYEDDEELEGEHKIAERDRHRWEFDPASSDDWKDRED